ncbi:Uncharacterised protein [Achromobacter sp. 2789STDY5608615]|nr:Uncharacterised protein [Achromobacter sp. 2789STDY5608615]
MQRLEQGVIAQILAAGVAEGLQGLALARVGGMVEIAMQLAQQPLARARGLRPVDQVLRLQRLQRLLCLGAELRQRRAHGIVAQHGGGVGVQRVQE